MKIGYDYEFIASQIPKYEVDNDSHEFIENINKMAVEIKELKALNEQSEERATKAERKASIYFWTGLSTTIIMTFVSFFLGKYFG